MEDPSSSSLPSSKRLKAAQGFSGSAMGESEITHVSPSPLQPHSDSAAPSPSTSLQPPQPRPLTANIIRGAESRRRGAIYRPVRPNTTSPSGFNYLPPPENSTMLQELGPQDDAMQQDWPSSSETHACTGEDIQPPFASNPLPPVNDSTEIEDSGFLENLTYDTDNPFPSINMDNNTTHQNELMSTSEVLEMIQESSPKPEQLFLPLHVKCTNAVQDLRFVRQPVPVISVRQPVPVISVRQPVPVPVMRPSTSNVPHFIPRAQTHWPYVTSTETRTNTVQDLRHATQPAFVLRPSNSNVLFFIPRTQTHWPYGTSSYIFHQSGNHQGCVSQASTFSNAHAPGPSAANNQGRQQLHQPQQRQLPQQRIITSLVPQRVLKIWVGPDQGQYLLSVAVAQVNQFRSNMLGMAAVIRDHLGVVQAAIMRRWDMHGYQNPTVAEESIYESGIAFSLRLGLKDIIAETESPWLVDRIKKFANHPGSSFTQFTRFEARCVGRNDNYVAQIFARESPNHSNAADVYWYASDVQRAFGTNFMPY